MKPLPLLSAAAGLVVAALCLLVAPDPPRPGAATSGDAALAARVATVLGDDTEGYRGLSVALVQNGRTTTAGVGDDGGGPLFEIGSTTKTMTAMLFADLVADGTVRPTDTLGTTLPGVRFADPDTASITLEELASQRSGLPRLAPGSASLLRSSFASVTGRNPYGQDVGALLDSARDAAPGDERGHVGYSNLGLALLGQALAARTGIAYPQLVTERILRPLGMSATVVDPPAGLAGRATGSTATGRATAWWSGAGYAPAGIGPVSTAADMAKLVAGTMAGTAPGADAATPRFTDDTGGGRIGYAWFTDRYGDREVTWHNGATGGFRSYLAFDRSTSTGVVVLGNTDRDVEWIGLRLLGAEPPASFRSVSPGAVRWGATLVLLIWAAVSLPLLAFGVGRPKARMRTTPDRLRVVAAALSTVAVLLLAHRIGTWLVIQPWWWAVAAGAAAAGAAVLALRRRELPTTADGKPPLRWAGFGVSAALSALVVIAVI